MESWPVLGSIRPMDIDERDDTGAGAKADFVPSKGNRAAALLAGFRQCSELARSMDWRGTLVVRNGELLVEQDGALFQAYDEPRFFRKTGRGIARPMRSRLKDRGIPIRTVFDVGANIGEVAIGFACHHPQARVFAFEPAPENLRRLDANVALQPERLGNLTIVREAMSDRRGEIDITVGADSLNTVVLGDNLDRLRALATFQIARVPTDSLDSCCTRFGVEEIDFLKVDIEGGEPLLSAAVRRLPGRIGSALVEMSRFNSLDAYLELVDAFAAAGLAMEDRHGEPVADPRGYIDGLLARQTTINAWFLPQR